MIVRIVASPLGELAVAGDGSVLQSLTFPGHRPPPRLGNAGHDPAAFADAAAQLEEWFSGARTAFDLPLRLAGTPFQCRVWEALLAVPYGTTTTYRELAAAAGVRGAARAVGHAVARNPVSLVVPCHRVVGSDGALTGYAGGLGRKRALLAHERRVAAARPAG